MGRSILYARSGGIPKFTYKIGERIGGNYEITHILGGREARGGIASGMGIVYVCYDHELKDYCVLKSYQNNRGVRKQGEEQFQNEALVWIRLSNHPNIVRAFSFEIYDAIPYIVSEFISPNLEGKNLLTHYLSSSLSTEQVIIWSLQFCDAMIHATANGIHYHRDIKPDNIMITPQGLLKITDFGLSRCMEQCEEEWIDHSAPCGDSLSVFRKQSGVLIAGTPPWMSPEQFSGHADLRSDVYAFGVTLFQMVCEGRLPFVADSFDGYQSLHTKRKPPKVKGPLGGVIRKCLHKKPGKRYQSFDSLRADLIDITHKTSSAALEQATFQKTKAPKLTNRVAAAYITLKQPERAIEQCKSMLEIDPENYPVLTNLGIALQTLGRWEEAEAAYLKALALDPASMKLNVNLGNLYADQGKLDASISAYQAALEIDQRYWKALLGLGTVLLEKQDPSSAVPILTNAVKQAGDEAGLPFYMLARGYRALGHHTQALSCYESAIDRLCDLDELHIEYCKHLLSCGKPQEAIHQTAQALRYFPGNVELLVVLAHAYIQQNVYLTAKDLLAKVLDIDPKHRRASILYGFTCARCGDLRGALISLERALLHHPNDKELSDLYMRLQQDFTEDDPTKPASRLAPRKHYEYFLSLVAAGQLVDAINQLTLYLSEYPSDVIALNILADAQLKNEDHFAAIATFNRSLEIDSTNINAHNNIGLLYSQIGQFEKAINHFSHSIELEPNNPEAYFNQGNAYSSLGKYPEAIENYRKFLSHAGDQYAEYVPMITQHIALLESN